MEGSKRNTTSLKEEWWNYRRSSRWPSGKTLEHEEQLAGAFSGSRAVNPLATAPPTW